MYREAWSTLLRHRTVLWWIHSLYALAFGIGVMWVGSTHWEFLRVAVLYVGFIWVTSLLMPMLARLRWLSDGWRERVRLIVNYFHRNFYQQVLFFVLPIYYASATWSSGNILFVIFIAACAVISTLDVVYDEHLSARRTLMAVFFTFNLFASANVVLPTVWHIANAAALPMSALIALAAFMSIVWPRARKDAHASLASAVSTLPRYATEPPPHFQEAKAVPALVAIACSAMVLFATVMWGRGFIPPAPLQVVRVDFGETVDRRNYLVPTPLSEFPAGWSGVVYTMTAIKAPNGLHERIAHRWYEDGRLVYASPFYNVTGGRPDGFRLWTSHRVKDLSARVTHRLDVVTESGQLIGRVTLPIQAAIQ